MDPPVGDLFGLLANCLLLFFIYLAVLIFPMLLVDSQRSNWKSPSGPRGGDIQLFNPFHHFCFSLMLKVYIPFTSPCNPCFKWYCKVILETFCCDGNQVRDLVSYRKKYKKIIIIGWKVCTTKSRFHKSPKSLKEI